MMMSRGGKLVLTKWQAASGSAGQRKITVPEKKRFHCAIHPDDERMRSELFLGGGKPIYPRKEMEKQKQKEEQDSAISSAKRNRKGKWMARCSACNETTRPTLLGIKKRDTRMEAPHELASQ